MAMSPAVHTIRLNTGADMPVLGLGTWQARPGGEAATAVRWALEAGYRLVDTAMGYENEEDVGRGLRESGVPRAEVFLTSKLENDDQGYESALRACYRSLADLQTDYLDLYLVHWPVPALRTASWRAMERLYDEGLCRAIGVSNYLPRHLEELLSSATVVPAVNQVEFHPYLYQSELAAYCRGRGIVLEAYSPLAKSHILNDRLVMQVADRLGRTPAQVVLAWHRAHRIPAIPKSVRRAHIEENLRALEVVLSAGDLDGLDGLDRGQHFDWDPTHER